MSVYSKQVALTVTAGGYSANDVVGGRINFGTVPAGHRLKSVIVSDLAKQAGAYQLVLFKDGPTDIDDNDTFSIADADIQNVAGAIHITDSAGADKFDFTNNKLYCRQGLDLPIDANTLFGFLIALGTPTYAATTDVRVTLLFAS